jgi:hypothetical protein
MLWQQLKILKANILELGELAAECQDKGQTNQAAILLLELTRQMTRYGEAIANAIDNPE